MWNLIQTMFHSFEHTITNLIRSYNFNCPTNEIIVRVQLLKKFISLFFCQCFWISTSNRLQFFLSRFRTETYTINHWAYENKCFLSLNDNKKYRYTDNILAVSLPSTGPLPASSIPSEQGSRVHTSGISETITKFRWFSLEKSARPMSILLTSESDIFLVE